MDLSAAAALCLWLLSACRPRDGLEAAAVLRAAGAGPAGSPGGGGGRTVAAAAGASAAPATAAAGARAVRRAAGSGFRNGSVVPHQFMMSLYRSLAARTLAGAAAASTSGSGRHGRADTITGFADQATQGTHAYTAPVHPIRSWVEATASAVPQLHSIRGAASDIRNFAEAHASEPAAPGLWRDPRQLAAPGPRGLSSSLCGGRLGPAAGGSP